MVLYEVSFLIYIPEEIIQIEWKDVKIVIVRKIRMEFYLVFSINSKPI